MTMKNRFQILIPVVLALAISAHAASPVVSNVRAQQRAGTKLVDVTYDLADPDSTQLAITIAVSTNAGATYTLPATSFTGAVGVNQSPGQNKKITWNAGADWPGKFSANVRFRVTADDSNTPPAPFGMVLISASSFTMGNCMDSSEGYFDELPTHTVSVLAFYMDKCEVTKAKWDEVKIWAIANGYQFDNPGSGKASAHPVHTVNWYDVVKWCNARSEMESKLPAYYTTTAQTTVYRTGQVTVQNAWVKWNAGYRLPTEAEWEKAARGGLNAKRFPWGDTITHSQANYYSDASYAYDISPTGGYHPAYNDGTYSCSSPVGSFTANGYGLYDMTGNVWEWCWDCYADSFYGTSQSDNPKGPTSGSCRVGRGGAWSILVRRSRVADRNFSCYPAQGSGDLGFRPVLPAGQ
jgi:formylglycine-generating enzyme required for sulfatase activity